MKTGGRAVSRTSLGLGAGWEQEQDWSVAGVEDWGEGVVDWGEGVVD